MRKNRLLETNQRELLGGMVILIAVAGFVMMRGGAPAPAVADPLWLDLPMPLPNPTDHDEQVDIHETAADDENDDNGEAEAS